MSHKRRFAVALIAFACGVYIAIAVFAGWLWGWV